MPFPVPRCRYTVSIVQQVLFSCQKERGSKTKDGNANVSLRAIKYYNSNDMLALAGDRSVGNSSRMPSPFYHSCGCMLFLSIRPNPLQYVLFTRQLEATILLFF